MHGLHLLLFGGQEEGRGDSGHWVRNSASFWAGWIAAVMCSGWGLRTAIPFEKVFCQVVCRCDIVSLFRSINPCGPSASISSATFEYFSFTVLLS